MLASSSQAIAGTLETIESRLISLRDGKSHGDSLAEQLIDVEDLEDEYLDEMLGEESQAQPPEEIAKLVDPGLLDAEIDELGRYSAWARSIGVDTKSRSLLTAIEIGFGEMERMGAERKALIFTESRRTQHYLRDFLAANGYAGKLVLFNGTNADARITSSI